MTSKDEFAGLFATYFGDKLSPAQIEAMVVDVVAAQADRRAREQLPLHEVEPSVAFAEQLRVPVPVRA